MKKTVTETNSFNNFLEFTWTVLVFSVTTYLVFWKGHSGWWYLLALLLASASLSTKKTEMEI